MAREFSLVSLFLLVCVALAWLAFMPMITNALAQIDYINTYIEPVDIKEAVEPIVQSYVEPIVDPYIEPITEPFIEQQQVVEQAVADQVIEKETEVDYDKDLDIGYEYSHAVGKHKEAALIARDCLKRKGVHQIWLERVASSKRFHRLCLADNGYWYDQILEKINGRWEEMTAFRAKDTTSWNVVREWLERKMATRISKLP